LQEQEEENRKTPAANSIKLKIYKIKFFEKKKKRRRRKGKFVYKFQGSYIGIKRI
jgi:hypothetical protein